MFMVAPAGRAYRGGMDPRTALPYRSLCAGAADRLAWVP
jgi:hypothetical protein